MTFDALFSTSHLVHLGGLFYAAGLLVRDELKLRLLILAGTGFYLAYYFLFPAQPLWDAIAVSFILGAANLFILGFIVFERTTLAMSDEERDLFAHFSTLNPGQFRRVMKRGSWRETKHALELTHQGEHPAAIYFLQEGDATVVKDGAAFALGPGNFVAELAFIRNQPASATVIAQAGCRYVEWDAPALKALMKRSVPIRNAILALFNANLADKLARSHRT